MKIIPLIDEIRDAIIIGVHPHSKTDRVFGFLYEIVIRIGSINKIIETTTEESIGNSSELLTNMITKQIMVRSVTKSPSDAATGVAKSSGS